MDINTKTLAVYDGALTLFSTKMAESPDDAVKMAKIIFERSMSATQSVDV